MERRALYNSLRMNWQLDSQIAVQPWQVENYRILSQEELFRRLHNYRINIDRYSFLQLSENCDTPEELVELLSPEDDEESNDKIYLIVFELWRRLVPEKQSLSIFCDELDYQIHLYDTGQAETLEGIEDALANLQILLDENADKGVDAKNLFSSISDGCANDIEDFLYDYTQLQIEHQNYLYAQELIEGFSPYVRDKKWFDFLGAEILYPTDREGALGIIESLVRNKKEQELEFNLEILSLLAKSGDEKLFKSLAKQTFALLELEEDFTDLASICADYFHYADNDKNELAIQEFLAIRKKSLDAPFDQNEAEAKAFFKILNS